MALLMLSQVRENIETGLSDAALQRIMDSVEDDIDQAHGEVNTAEDDLVGGEKSIWVLRPILTVTTVTETVGTVDTVLASDDYVQRYDRQIDRLDTGTNARERWGCRVKIAYAPVDTTNRRIMVYLKIILLEIVYSGLDSSREGDFNSKALDYASERIKILNSLSRPAGFV